MKKLVFYILDVFAHERYTGNQLAVVRDAGPLSDLDMLNIAKEMNYSETTFIVSGKQEDNGYNVRIFTPAREVPFAGHPTLGTASVIQREIIRKPVKKIKLNLKSGQIPVAFKYDRDTIPSLLWMKQKDPEFLATIEASSVAEVLCIDSKDIDTRFPIQEVSTGLPFIIIPLKKLSDVKKVKVNLSRYHELIQKTAAKALFIFCPESYSDDNDINARMFADYFGIPEDPATGSAGGCLGGYLVHHRYYETEIVSLRVEQGYEIGRPSLIHVRAEKKENHIELNVGGKVVMIARGELL